MRRVAAVFLLAAAAFPQDADDDRGWRILPYEPFEAGPVAPAPEAEALIEALVDVDAPRSGLTSTWGGGIGFSFTDDAFGRLVRLGPAALPAVLKHLDDARPTKLVFESAEEDIGGMIPTRALLVPPGRSDERRRILAACPGAVTNWEPGLDFEQRLTRHVVTVGDCCFAILGEIVNRPYEAVRGQGSALTAVCSPTRDPQITAAARAAWGRGGAHVLRSLLDDFHTRGGNSSLIQTGAAARLALYFPERGGSLVAQRIAGLAFDRERDDIDAQALFNEVLKVDHPEMRAAWMKHLDPDAPRLEVLRAIRRAPAPEVRARLTTIFDRTRDTDVLLECADWIPLDREGTFERLERTLKLAGDSNGQDLLQIMIRADVERAIPVCRGYAKGGHERTLGVIGAIYWERNERAARALLPPMLESTVPLRMYRTPGSFDDRGRRTRDFAAAALARAVDGLTFTNPDTDDAREREVAVMIRAVEGG